MPSSLSPATLKLLQHEINQQALPNAFLTSIEHWLLPIATLINTQYHAKTKPLIISFNGAQGSGKSTLTCFISLLLKHHFKTSSLSVSLDDFYATKQHRLRLAQDIHPLLKTRGVPGTHDLNLAITTLNHLKKCSTQDPCFIPIFDKASDDRTTKEHWKKVETPIEIILFEGWCNHAPIQTPSELKHPINALEAQEDPNGVWRSYVNKQLNLYHQKLFSLCDQLYFIKIPNFEKIKQWRGLQEQKLADCGVNSKIMDQLQLERFIQHYERITRQCLQTLTNTADAIITLDKDHQIKQITHQ